MTVAQLIHALSKLPPDATFETVRIHDDGRVEILPPRPWWAFWR